MSTAPELISALKDGQMRADQLAPDELEEVVYFHVQGLLHDKIPAAVVQRNKRGEVDVVVEATPLAPVTHSLPPDKPLRIYIECKHYNRRLEFDRAAKVFCVAIRDLPDQLVIVTSRGLAPQAWHFARYFFTTERHRGIFHSVQFVHQRLEDFLEITQEERTHRRSAGKRPSATFVVRWGVYESDAYAERSVASAESSSGLLLVRPSSEYELEVVVTADTPHREPELELLLDGETIGASPPSSEAEVTNDMHYLLRFPMALWEGHLKAPGRSAEQSAPSLQARLRLGQHEATFTVAQVSFVQDLSFLGDLRAQTTQQVQNSLLADGYQPLVLIGGDAGVGKSHFCDLTLARLRKERSYRCTRISLGPESTPRVFFRLLWSLIEPSLQATDATADSSLRDLIAACLEKLLEQGERGASAVVAERMAAGDYASDDAETLAFLCARLICLSPTPQAILFQNCHEAGSDVLRALKLVLASMGDEGWGSARVFIEYRTASGPQPAEWREFIAGVKRDLASSLHHHVVQPVTEQELASSLDSVLLGSTGAELAPILFQKAGGNPLFIRQILHLALEKGYVSLSHQKEDGLFVEDFTALRDELDTVPLEIEELLTQRLLGIINSGDGETENRKLSKLLAISAMIGMELDEERLERTTGLAREEMQEVEALLFSAGVLVPSLSAPPGAFVHELMLLAARQLSPRLKTFRRAMADLKSDLKEGSFSDALIGGRASLALGDYGAAYDWYNASYEVGKKRGEFAQQRMALRGCRDVLAQCPPLQEGDRRKGIVVDLALAWAEIQGGSQAKALEVLGGTKEVLRAMAPSEGSVRANETYLLLQECYYDTLLVLVRLLRPVEFLSSFREAYPLATRRSDQLRLLTRLLLMSCHAGQPESAVAAALECLKHAPGAGDDEYSSLCSDIGRIYLQSQPGETSTWWRQGLDRAASRRQVSHSRLNLAVAGLYLGTGIPDDSSLQELREDITGQSVWNQLSRLDLMEGILRCAAGAFEESRALFTRALRRAQSVGQVYWEWKCQYNLGVLEYLQGRNREASNRFLAAEHILRGVLNNRADLGGRFATSLSEFSFGGHANEDSPGGDPLAVPSYCGLYRLLVHVKQNLEPALSLPRDAGPLQTDSPIAVRDSSPLRIRVDAGHIYLAIE